MENKLTDREYWANYWANYEFKLIPENVLFKKYIPGLQGAESFIEIGGFPGEVAAYFYKNVCTDIHILDYYIDKAIINKLERVNSIPENSFKCIEADFFEYSDNASFDIVFSYGFIEHFDNTEDVLTRHIRLLSDNGKLLVILPNFRGLNGLVQYLFDRDTYKVHNLKSMIPKRLRQILIDARLSNIEVTYSPKPMIWLEPKPNSSRLLRNIIKVFSYALKLIPIPGRLLSPYIIIYAEKNSK
jgi:SAM-dependent methyltransferase